MARLAPLTRMQFLDDSGVPLASGTVNTYKTGTTTNKATYTDQTEGAANANPVVLDANGEADIWLLTDEEYRFVIKNSGGTTVKTIDNINGIFSPIAEAYESNSIKFANNKEIQDDSGNAIVVWGKTTSAVNELKISNAATGSGPTITTQGGDTNVDINFTTKGSGAFNVTATSNITGDLDVDNLNLDGNTLISTDANGAINITPNGTGDVVLDGVKWPQADGTSGQALTTDGSAQSSWTTLPLRGFLGGLNISNAADADHDIQVAVGQARDAADAGNITVSSALIKKIDASWVAGSNAGGFPSALTLAASTSYHFFVIAKTDGTADAGFDTSLTATNLLTDATGYTLYRRVGSLTTDASLNIRGFTQFGDEFALDVPLNVFQSTNPGTSQQTVTLTGIPTGVRMVADFGFSYHEETPSGSRHALILPTDATDTAPSSTVNHIRMNVAEDGHSITKRVLTNTSGQIAYRVDVSAADTVTTGVVSGWTDYRGRAEL